MKNPFIHLLAVAVMAYSGFAGSISDDLDDWILGLQPQILDGSRPDGSDGPYINIPVGTSAFYYELMHEGEGTIEFWVNDAGKCLADSNPGYPNHGPVWGLMTSSFAAICVGILRFNDQGGCSGYSVWSTVAPYNEVWFKDGLRGANGTTFAPGWYRWTVSAGWNDIAFTLHNVTYHLNDGPPYDDPVFGDCTQRYGTGSAGGIWDLVFGDGFQSVYMRGDGSGGCENIDVYITAGSGVFREVSDTPLPVSGGYQNTGWSELKELFR